MSDLGDQRKVYQLVRVTRLRHEKNLTEANSETSIHAAKSEARSEAKFEWNLNSSRRQNGDDEETFDATIRLKQSETFVKQ